MIKNASFKLTHNKENLKKIKFFCSKAVMIDILKDDELSISTLNIIICSVKIYLD